jgi:hypothetical protein
LKYPTERVAARFWTLHIFLKSFFSELKQCTKVVNDSVDFLVPLLSECPEVKCSEDGKHSKELSRLLLSKFFYGVMRTEEDKSKIRLDKKPIVFNKPEKRKVLKLQK